MGTTAEKEQVETSPPVVEQKLSIAERQAQILRERKEKAAEDVAKRQAAAKAALEKAQNEQTERAEQRAVQKAEMQTRLSQRSYFGDTSVMGDNLQGGKVLPKEEVSNDVRDML